MGKNRLLPQCVMIDNPFLSKFTTGKKTERIKWLTDKLESTKAAYSEHIEGDAS